ncbi:hypothetical protein KIW84_022430 [Lathyrus oleraceus]|uniref:Integrase catalytic domain-containing protein n=1 Tax=Pisum sativum TaxID=3888 RepID=A0A9D5BAR6_PEA|nr:hypothetical protein KIW84_022430 [Pisum sativum]
MKFLENQEYSENASITDKKYLRKLSSKFFLNGGVLYKRNYDSDFLKCVKKQEANQIIMEIHEGSFRIHASGHTMVKKIFRVGYYWMTVEVDSIEYFTKWVEAVSYANVTRQVVARFLRKEIICHYGVPSKIIIDNGSKLNNKMILARVIPFTLHGYLTSVHTSIGTTLFYLVYGVDAVLPVEVEIPSLRILTSVKLDKAEWVQARFDQLNLIDEKCFATICHDQLYQKCIKRAHDKKVFPHSLKAEDLVLKKILPIHTDPRGK